MNLEISKHPSTARMMVRPKLGEGVDLNLYRYCGNSPVNFSDPDGLKPTSFELSANIYSTTKKGKQGPAFVKFTCTATYESDNGNLTFSNGKIVGEIPGTVTTTSIQINVDTRKPAPINGKEALVTSTSPTTGPQFLAVGTRSRNVNIQPIIVTNPHGIAGANMDIRLNIQISGTAVHGDTVGVSKSTTQSSPWMWVGPTNDAGPPKYGPP